MLKFTSAALALLCAIVVFATPAQSSVVEDLFSANVSCTSEQTVCGSGCCPYADAVCCSDGFECCQHGQVCIPYAGICIGVVNEEEKDLALVSNKATPVENLMTPCPSGTTTCAPGRCCIFPDATCCSDSLHCCPNGYRCDLPNNRCVKNSDNTYFPFDISASSGMTAFHPVKAVRKTPLYKSCPGGDQQCPSDMSCCLDDDGAWSCCLNPKSLQYQRKGSNQCCNTQHGYICCPGACSYFLGCL